MRAVIEQKQLHGAYLRKLQLRLSLKGQLVLGVWLIIVSQRTHLTVTVRSYARTALVVVIVVGVAVIISLCVLAVGLIIIRRYPHGTLCFHHSVHSALCGLFTQARSQHKIWGWRLPIPFSFLFSLPHLPSLPFLPNEN